jgi:T-complex protein 1 subunit gamma
LSNIAAARAVADIIRTTLGPRSMLKVSNDQCWRNIANLSTVFPLTYAHCFFLKCNQMLLDPMGGIVITNDGHCILREVDVSHPTAKSMMELSRAQDEEVGDGTTSVIILAGEMLTQAQPFLASGSALHPTVLVQAYHKALQEALAICERYVAVEEVGPFVS